MSFKEVFDKLVNYEFEVGNEVQVEGIDCTARVIDRTFGFRKYDLFPGKIYEVMYQTEVQLSSGNKVLADLVGHTGTFGENELH